MSDAHEPTGRPELIEQAASAWRPSDRARGGPQPHPAWHDLDAAGREEAFALAYQLRQLEAATDPGQLSHSARLVLARIRGSLAGPA